MSLLLEQKIRDFDVLEFLNKHDIEYKTEGKNIGNGWIGLRECLNNMCGDSRFHMGINLDRKIGHCWSCGYNFSLNHIIMKVAQVSYREATEIIVTNDDTLIEDIEYAVSSVFHPEKLKNIEVQKLITMPESLPITKSIIRSIPKLRNFLDYRKITRQDCQNYGLSIGTYGLDKGKLIIPIKKSKKLIAYQTRSIDKNIKGYYSYGPLKSCIYNQSKLHPNKNLILVEGFLDFVLTERYVNKYLSSQYETSCLFSKILSKEQGGVINELNPKKVIMMFDRDAWYSYAQNEAWNLNCEIQFIILPEGKDPGSMDEKEFLKIFRSNNL